MQYRISVKILRRLSPCPFWPGLRRQHDKARVVLLPEVPTDTADNNKFVRCIESGSLPDIASWTMKDSVNGAAKFGLEYEGWLLDYIDEESEDSNRLDSTSFASLMDPLERSSVPVDYAWYTCRNHFAALFYNNENASAHVRGLQKMISRLTHTRFSTPSFCKAVKELCSSGKVTDARQMRLLQNYVLECTLNGLDLQPHKCYQLGQIRERFEAKKMEYEGHVEQSSVKLNDRAIETLSEVPDAPEYVLRCLADNLEGPIWFPFTFKYSPVKYPLFMRYCRKRLMRWALWSSVNNRAAFVEDVAMFNNSKIVEEIRGIRGREASWLGYRTYADLQLSVCMAKSVDEVQTFLTRFGESASNELDTLYEDMCNLAEAQGENTTREPPDAWDLDYYSRLVAADKYKLDHHELALYFPYPQTMRNIFQEIALLFDVEFRDVTKSTPIWHPTVQVYEIRNGPTDTLLGHLYVDPYMRKGKFPLPIAMEGRPRSTVSNCTPIAYLSLDLVSPKKEKPSLIYFDQLSSLSFQLGKALQYVLSTGEYSGMLGDRMIEWDCKDVCARVVELLITSRPQFLVDISHHCQHGQKLDLQTAQNFVKGRVTSNLPSIVREVVDSELDLSLYSSGRFWRDTYNELHTKYLPYKWNKKKGDEFICSFGGYVTENTASKYYSVLWSKMIASDIVDTFVEAQKEGQEQLLETGKRFCELYLSKGGEYSQLETFTRFRGREPIIDPMRKYYVSF